MPRTGLIKQLVDLNTIQNVFWGEGHNGTLHTYRNGIQSEKLINVDNRLKSVVNFHLQFLN